MEKSKSEVEVEQRMVNLRCSASRFDFGQSSREQNMTLTVTTKLSALKLPAVVEKDGVRYKCDIVDDDQGIDLVLEKEENS